MSISVAIVEDSNSIRASLCRMIADTPGLRCLWAAPTAEEALAEAARLTPEVVLMDIHLPNISGIECTARLKQLPYSIKPRRLRPLPIQPVFLPRIVRSLPDPIPIPIISPGNWPSSPAVAMCIRIWTSSRSTALRLITPLRLAATNPFGSRSRDTIQRYAPNGSGFAAPTIAFTAPAGTPQPTKIQFGEFRVTGSGASTVIVAGNRDWYGNVDRILTTTDGLTFTEVTAIPTGAGSGGGGLSSVVPAADNVDDRVIFRTSYPSTSNGVDSRIHRRRQVGATGDFIADTLNPEQVPGSEVTNSTDVIYRTLFLTDAQTLPGLPYVVAYSTPSFRTFDNPTVQSALKASSPDDMP